MTPQSIRRAAEVLRREAASVRNGNYCAATGKWGAHPLEDWEASHDEMLDLARKLERLAKDRAA